MSNQLTLTTKMLTEPSSLREVFELEPFKNNYVNNYAKTTGVAPEKAAMIFEREKILFMKAIAANKQLESCDRFTIYSAFIELAVSGCSLLDGESYIIPYDKKAQFQVGYKGRINQMNTLPGIEYVHMPQVVYDCDVFEYELGENPKIIKHVPNKKRPDDARIEFVYMVIDREPTPSNPKAKEVYIMDREEVLGIRDRYSKSYKYYIADCLKHKKQIGETFQVEKQGYNGPYMATIEPPMWITSEPEAWKKTIAKRAYKWAPKTARLKALDAKIANNLDPEDGSQGEQDIDYGIVDDAGNTTQVKAETPKSTENKTTKAKKDKPAETTKQNTPSAKSDIDDIANANTSETIDAPSEVVDDVANLGDPLKGF